MYASMCEDNIVWEIFRRKPHRFLDLGAGDGKTLSNTYYLAEQGWSGVWIDGNPDQYDALCENAKRFDGRIRVVGAPVTAAGGPRTMWLPAERNVATLSPELFALGHERAGARELQVQSWSVKSLFDRCPGPYDFISIDIDGLCLEAMRAIDFKAVGCRCLCIEFLPASVLGVDERPIIEEYMDRQGFRKFMETPENLILTRR